MSGEMYESAAGYGYVPSYEGDGDEATYYGAEDESSSGGLMDTIRGYAAQVASSWGVKLGFGVVVGAAHYFLSDELDRDWIPSVGAGLIGMGALHFVSVLVASGFESLKSASPWYGAGLIAAGWVFPHAAEYVQEKLGGMNEGWTI